MEDNKDNKNKKDQANKTEYKRIGTVTFGIILILTGISTVVFMFTDALIFRYVVMLWPLFLVSLGVETLYYSNKKDIAIKYDVWNIILTTGVIGFTILLSMGNFAINEIFFRNDRIQRVVDKAAKRIEENLGYEYSENLIEHIDTEE